MRSSVLWISVFVLSIWHLRGKFSCGTNTELGLTETCFNSNNLMLCESNLRCDIGSAMADDAASSGTNQCVAQTKYSIGARCTVHADCLSGNCSQGGCLMGTKLNGDSCSHSEECASQSCNGNLCRPTYTANQQCTSVQDCRIGYFCRPSAPTATICVKGFVGINNNPSNTAFQCADDTDCLSGTYCNGSSCVASLPNG